VALERSNNARPTPAPLERSNNAPPSPCPTWDAFLARVTGNDQALASFLKRLAGYALTGDTSAHALFFLYGTGANGKSVFTSTLAGILNDYQATAPIETFTASATDRHPTELAGLRAARLVTATETEEGRRWAEARIKALTGGDAIPARYMRQDFFEYVPQFKLVIAGNHKPGLRAVDEAIRRRFHLVPFEVTIPAHERDARLTEKLKAEWPGILAWAIEGCLDWQGQGLNPPPAVVAATSAYLDAQDAVSAWADECCATDGEAFELTAELYTSWVRWAATAGEPAGNRKRFADALGARGMQAHRRNDGRGFRGLRLKPRHDPDEYWRR